MTDTPLASERWHRIEELFQAATDLPPDQRDRFLRETCGSDEQLRSEIEKLLAKGDEESPLIGSIVDDATNNLLDDES